jgi:hypothetical protein
MEIYYFYEFADPEEPGSVEPTTGEWTHPLVKFIPSTTHYIHTNEMLYNLLTTGPAIYSIQTLAFPRQPYPVIITSIVQLDFRDLRKIQINLSDDVISRDYGNPSGPPESYHVYVSTSEVLPPSNIMNSLEYVYGKKYISSSSGEEFLEILEHRFKPHHEYRSYPSTIEFVLELYDTLYYIYIIKKISYYDGVISNPIEYTATTTF